MVLRRGRLRGRLFPKNSSGIPALIQPWHRGWSQAFEYNKKAGQGYSPNDHNIQPPPRSYLRLDIFFLLKRILGFTSPGTRGVRPDDRAYYIAFDWHPNIWSNAIFATGYCWEDILYSEELSPTPLNNLTIFLRIRNISSIKYPLPIDWFLKIFFHFEKQIYQKQTIY